MITLVKDITSLSDNDLLNYSKKLAQHENKIGLRIIECLREAERRMLYIPLGFSSLWDFATRFLGLSHGNAHLKISAMRLARDLEVAQEKIEKGELSLTNAAKVNTFFRQEEKAGHAMTVEQKNKVIQSVAGLSQSQCERVLLSLAPEAIPAEKVRLVTDTMTEIKVVVNQDTLAVLERLRELLSHKIPNATYAELLDCLAREKVEALEKKQMGTSSRSDHSDKKVMKELKIKEDKRNGKSKIDNAGNGSGQVKPTDSLSSTGEVIPPQESGNSTIGPTLREYISVVDRRWVMRRAMGQCEHISPDGLRCSSRWKLELDHIRPLALGGKNERSNYRIACKNHNLYYAKVSLGTVMNEYVPSLR